MHGLPSQLGSCCCLTILLLILSQFILPADRTCHVPGTVQGDINKVAYSDDRCSKPLPLSPWPLSHSPSSPLHRLPCFYFTKKTGMNSPGLSSFHLQTSHFNQAHSLLSASKEDRAFLFPSGLLRHFSLLYLVLSVISSFIYFKFVPNHSLLLLDETYSSICNLEKMSRSSFLPSIYPYICFSP